MTDVVMPQMGESIVEGTLTKWLKKPGERVERDEPLFEISTDKVDTEIPSPAAGTLAEVLVEEGKTVGINTVVARIEEAGAGAPAAKPAAQAAQPAAAAAPAPAPERRSRRRQSPRRPSQRRPVEEPAPAGEPAGPLSPLVRKHGAREQHRSERRSRAPAPAAASPSRTWRPTWRSRPAAGCRPPRRARQPPAPAAPPPPHRRRPPLAPLAARRRRPRRASSRMSTMRIKIAEHMVLSKRTSAHVTTIHRVDMTKVAKMRERHKAAVPGALRLLA